jgi:hypothetical protein
MTDEEVRQSFFSKPWSHPFPCPNSGEPGYVPRSLAAQYCMWFFGTQTQAASE